MIEFKACPASGTWEFGARGKNPLVLVQEQECAAFSEVELQPEEVVHRDASDLCLVQNTGLIRKVAQVIECKHT